MKEKYYFEIKETTASANGRKGWIVRLKWSYYGVPGKGFRGLVLDQSLVSCRFEDVLEETRHIYEKYEAGFFNRIINHRKEQVHEKTV